MDGHGTGSSDRNMSPDDFRKVVGIGLHTRDVPFVVIMNILYKIARNANLDVNLSVDHPSQQWKFGQPLIATIRKNFPNRNSTFIEAARKAIVSIHWRKYRKNFVSARRGRGHPKGASSRSSNPDCRAHRARSDTPPYRKFRKSSQTSSSHQSLPMSTSSSNQATRAAPPSYRSNPSASTSYTRSDQRYTTAFSSTRNGASSNARDYNRRPSPDLPEVKRFLESCSRGLGDLAPLFIDYGCNSREYLMKVSEWNKTDIYAFLNRVANHHVANADAPATMLPMDVELIARRCSELGLGDEMDEEL